MCIPNLNKFCPFIPKILSGNEILTSTKGRYYVTNLRKMTVHNPILDLINVNGLQNLVKFCHFVLKILSPNEILTSIKGCNSVSNLQKMTLYNPDLDLINIVVYTKFGEILSIHSKDIEPKRNSDIYQGP